MYDDHVGDEITCSAEDLKLDLQHNLATYIKVQHWATPNSKAWTKWVDNHFVQVRRVFRRLEKVYGITSFDSVQEAGLPLSEQPALGMQHKSIWMQCVAKKPSGQN